MSNRIAASAILLISILLVGCKLGERPDRIVELCVNNEQGVSKFLSELEAIATGNRMKYTDNSDNTRSELQEIMKHDSRGIESKGTINVSVDSTDGLGLTAGNLGLPRHQIVIGFSSGRSKSEGKRFYKSVLIRLGRHWTVRELPNSVGAKPMGDCG